MTTTPNNLDRIAFNALAGEPIMTGISHDSIYPFHNEDVARCECPCRDCTKAERRSVLRSLPDGYWQALAEWRFEQFPEIWPCP